MNLLEDTPTGSPSAMGHGQMPLSEGLPTQDLTAPCLGVWLRPGVVSSTRD